jgi:prephenate dehydratase
VLHPIRHCLIAAEPGSLAPVRTVASHPQATAQCAAFLRDQLPGAAVRTAASTAEAVRSVVEGGAGAGDAAIGSRAAAELYGGHVLAAGIEDVPGNETRFAWLAPAGTAPVDLSGRDPAGDVPWRTALVWWGAGSGSPGWLVRCLSEFAFRGVNLTRIESRPLREAGTREYRFFVDADGRAGDPALAAAIEALRGHAGTVRVLGSHPAAG